MRKRGRAEIHQTGRQSPVYTNFLGRSLLLCAKTYWDDVSSSCSDSAFKLLASFSFTLEETGM